MVLGEPELACRAEHAFALDAAQARAPDFRAGQASTDARKRHLHAGAHVGRAAHDLETLAARVYGADGELVGVRVARHLDDLGDHHAAELRPDRLVCLHLDTGHRQALGELGARHRRVAEAPQPALGYFHGNCARKRKSPSKKSRRSSIP